MAYTTLSPVNSANSMTPSPAVFVMTLSDDLVGQANAVAAMANERLSGYVLLKTEVEKAPTQNENVLPPYFNQLRNNLNSVRERLATIQRLIETSGL